MGQDTSATPTRVGHDRAHASLGRLGSYLRRTGFCAPLETQGQINQKPLKYRPVQKLEKVFVALLAPAKVVSHTRTTVGGIPRSGQPLAGRAVPISR